MSLIATFHTLPQDSSDALLQAATPEIKVVEKKGLLFKKKVEERVDHFFDFLKEHAAEQDEYPYSGDGFCDLDLVLEDKGCLLFDAGSCDLASKMSEVRGTSIAVFDRAAAAAALQKLDSVRLTQDELHRFYQEEGRPEDEEAGSEAVLAAFAVARKWLASVAEEQIGLLIVG